VKLPSAERSAQAGIVLLFIVIIRSLGEYFRLEYEYGYALPRHILSMYVGGALIAVVATVICVVFYFFRRYRSVVVLVVIAIAALLVFKIRYIHP
jgi:hypothetical protein